MHANALCSATLRSAHRLELSCQPMSRQFICRMQRGYGTQVGSSVAIIGGGLAGSAAAGALCEDGFSTSVFDMGFRGPGGRASSRSYDKLQFDHGCQFLLPSSRTAELEGSLAAAGALQPWTGKSGSINAVDGAVQKSQQVDRQSIVNDFCGWSEQDTLLVGVPGMSAVCSQLSARDAIQKHWRHKVTGIERSKDGTWSVHAIHKMPGDTPDEPVSYGNFDWLILADRLLAKPGSPCCIDFEAAESSALVSTLRGIESQPTITLMLAYAADSPLRDVPLDAVAVQGSSSLKWISNDSSKPGRPKDSNQICWTVLSTPSWAADALGSESDRSPVKSPATGGKSALEVPRYAIKLLQDFEALMQKVLGKQLPLPAFLEAQRWGAAFKAKALEQPYLVDEQLRLAACGDFCVQASAQGALSSGLYAAEALSRLVRSSQ